MQDHDRNISVGSTLDEPTQLFIPDIRSKSSPQAKMRAVGTECNISVSDGNSPKKLIDYRKQRASVSHIDYLDSLLSPKRHRASPHRFLEETEMPSLALSLEDSIGTLSLTETRSCFHESGGSSSNKVEFYLKVPKRAPKCTSRENLQTLVSKMYVPKCDPSIDHAPRRGKASRRMSADDCYRQRLNPPTNIPSSGFRKLEAIKGRHVAKEITLDSTEQRQQRLKRLSGFCSMRSLCHSTDNSLTKLSEIESFSSEQFRTFDTEQESTFRPTSSVHRISRDVSLRHVKDDQNSFTERHGNTHLSSARERYPIEIIIPHPILSRTTSLGEQERKNQGKTKGRRSYTSNNSLNDGIRRCYSTGEEMNTQCLHFGPSKNQRLHNSRRWSSSFDGRSERPHTSSTALYTEWKIELMLKSS